MNLFCFYHIGLTMSLSGIPTYIVFQFKVRICITKPTAISLMVPTCSRPITEVKLGEPSQYWDGLPPWKTGCCWQSTVLQLLTKLVDYVNDTQFTINWGFSKQKDGDKHFTFTYFILAKANLFCSYYFWPEMAKYLILFLLLSYQL